MEKIKVGIIGTGQATSISKGHLMGIRLVPEAELSGIYDLNPQAMEAWCEAYGVDKALCYASCDQLIEDSDVLCICTPNFTHAEYICRCLEKNKHVVAEKPISHTSADIPAMKAAIAGSSARGITNLSYRHMPGIRMIHDLIASGEAGKVYFIRQNMGGSRLANEAIPLEWRFVKRMSGTGATGDFGSHTLDLMHYILGEENSRIVSMQAMDEIFIPQRTHNGQLADVENDDGSVTICRLAGGTLYSMLVSRVGATESLLEVVAANAIIRFSMMQPDRIRIQRRTAGGAYGPEETVISQNCRPVWHEVTPMELAYWTAAENVSSFLEALKTGAPCQPDLDYGIQVLEEVERIAASAAANR